MSNTNRAREEDAYAVFENRINIRDGRRADERDLFSVLEVVGIEHQIHLNTTAHETWMYAITTLAQNRKLVIRRGKPFRLTLRLNRPYDRERDDLRLHFVTNSAKEKGPNIELSLHKGMNSKNWGVRIVDQKRETLTLDIFTPADCIVGRWLIKVSSVNRRSHTIFRYFDDKSFIYILFNPWCKEDLVHFPTPGFLQEYILEEKGFLYYGTSEKPRKRDWLHGQFKYIVLDCAMVLLENSGLEMSKRGDPIEVSRELSAVTNAPDDNGVLVGNWSGNYSGGTPPTKWTGSHKILEQYYQTQRPVKFGQCWVFSGVLTTLCRTLGIPARSVTCYDSAHDTDGSTTIDVYVTSDGAHQGEDSIWNFHVWNEIWTKRPDLSYSGCDGWQVIDGTPQEKSKNVFRCGPCPVAAVKHGVTSLDYDTPFVFAEVNADKVYWKKVRGEDKKIHTESDRVGTKVVTRYPNNEYPYQDITNDYKFKERSQHERYGITRAAHGAELIVEFMDSDSMYGADFQLAIRVMNKTSSNRTISGIINIYSCYTNGRIAGKIKSSETRVTVRSGTYKDIPVQALFEEYDEKIVEHCHLKVNYVFDVEETGYVFADQRVFALDKPELRLSVQRQARAGDSFPVEISFKNPLDKVLTNCSVDIECTDMEEIERRPRDIMRRGALRETVYLTIRKPMIAQIVAVFNADQLLDVKGSCAIKITKNL